MKSETIPAIEWPTLALITGCYAIWAALVTAADMLHPALWVPAMAIVITFYWSLVHEAIHGHPTRIRPVNEALVGLPIGWVFPVGRFRDTHIAHHETPHLTNPLDDPESWYVLAPRWQMFNPVWQKVLVFNNTLLGRMLIGPLITVARFVASEVRLISGRGPGWQRAARNWAQHLLICGAMVFVLALYTPVSLVPMVLASWLGLSLLLIRTFLEHQASENEGERTVIIEQNCPIAFLFLYNNLHVVHHMYPGIPWYRLPHTFQTEREAFLEANNGYVYKSYAEIFRRYFLRPKEPVIFPAQ